MRNLLFGFWCLAVGSPLVAQDAVRHSPAALQVTALVAGGGACHEACPANVCVSQPTTKKTTKTVFSSKCVEFCLPKCSGHFSGGCDNCAENCGHVRTKNVLLKKVVTEECPSTECVVAPACTTTAPAVVAPAKDGKK